MSEEIEILIVEESLPQAEQLKHILEQHDHKVSVEHDAQLALAAMRQRQPQIVISAVHLPEMDGYELCREIKADEQLKNIPVILLTSLSDTTDIIRGMECGADNFVTKPYDEKLLISRIEYIVLNRELRVGAGTQTGLEIIFNGEKYSITPERQQMVDLLISTYETAVQKNLELLRVQEELNALNERLEEKVKERTAELMEEVADRKQVELALRQAEEKYRSIFENAVEGIFQSTTDGRFIAVNPAMARILGYESPEELISHRVDIGTQHYVDANCRAKLERMLMEQGIVVGFECEVFRQDQSKIWTVETIRAIRDEDGAVLYYEGSIEDITERKRVEERQVRRAAQVLLRADIGTALARSDSFLRSILEQCAEAIVQHLGAAFARIWTLNQDENVLELQASAGMYTHIDGPHSRVPVGAFKIGLIAEERQPHITNNVQDDPRVSDKKWAGREGMVAFAGHPLIVEGRLVGVMALFARQKLAEDTLDALASVADIMSQGIERKRAEEALRASAEQLRQSQKMEAIGTLAGGVAHDFNNLLTAILGNTQLALRQLVPDDPLQLRLIDVEKAANRATMLTRQLLAFSRRQHLERRTINLNDTIAEIMKLLQRIIGEDVEVRVKVAPALSAVFADPAQIEQVIMNLAVNARDAMPEGGQLTIETSNIELDESYRRKYAYVQPGKYVEIRVSDTGSGIDEETQAHIFEPFFTTKELRRGTGLGLSMVYGIIKQHDGHINVYSEVGHGTTFKIFLPVDEKNVENEAQAIQLPLLGGTETILVAEDEETLRNLAREVLEGLGYTVLLAKNGEDAVEMYEQNREQIDLLLLDLVMPRMGGWEAYERIHELGDDVALIFMTGYSSETVQSRFVKQNKSMEELGAVLLQKPYNVEGLARKVREVLNTARRK